MKTINKEQHLCPVCGEHEFSNMNSNDICPICNWQDDGSEMFDEDIAGPNDLPYKQYKERYLNIKSRNYKCPKCNSIMRFEVKGSDLHYVCKKCGAQVATTYSSGINWDANKYTIVLKPDQEKNKKIFKLISDITGKNYYEVVSLLKNGGVLIIDAALKIKEVAIKLEKENILYKIEPDFKW